MSEAEPQFLRVGDGESGRRIAYVTRGLADASPGLMWLSGFKSDMSGTKAQSLAAWAAGEGYACTLFDYSGHGLSNGRFEDGSIGDWLADAEAVLKNVALKAYRGSLILVGSSMGGYIALLLLRRLLERDPASAARIAALVLIAPAWDMTEELLWKNMNDAGHEAIKVNGVAYLPSAYGDPIPITRRLIEEGRSHLLKDAPFDPGRPVLVLQGAFDPDVPPSHARELTRLLPGGWVDVTEVPDGDHGLSRPRDLKVLFGTIKRAAVARRP